MKCLYCDKVIEKEDKFLIFEASLSCEYGVCELQQSIHVACDIRRMFNALTNYIREQPDYNHMILHESMVLAATIGSSRVN